MRNWQYRSKTRKGQIAHRGHAFEPETNILNICCNVFVLHCLLTVIFQFCYGVFRLNVRDNDERSSLRDVTHVDYDANVYAAFHKALYWHSSRDAAELDAILLQIY